MKNLILILALLFSGGLTALAGQYRSPVKPTKNLVVMIPDGTSIGMVTAARWYQIHNQTGSDRLAVDPWICGVVKTFCSNAPIGDSAPTTSCYMTGMPQKSGNVSIYPVCDKGNDLCQIDPARAYQPLATILEAVKYYQGKSTGLVVTCEFPHATPADCAAHYYNRSAYDCIAPQMAYNNLDVMFGGGTRIVTDDIRKYFSHNGTTLIEKDAKAFRSYSGKGRVWALFADASVPYDLDRDDALVPSLAEMTKKALDILSQNEKGFFLMVEGSKIDFAAHANDSVGCITEFLAFDRAVREVIEFARKDGDTTVVILPDHGNSGFTIGNHRSSKGYNVRTLEELFADVSRYKMTGTALAQKLELTKPDQIRQVVREYTGIELKDGELHSLLKSANYKMGDQSGKNGKSLRDNLIAIMNSRTYFGYTTTGHTGEDVFLAAYHPAGHVPIGMNTNVEINHYLFDAAGLTHSLDEMTAEIYARHTDVFQGMDVRINRSKKEAILVVESKGRRLEVPAFKSIVYLDGKEIDLDSVVVYIDKNDTFYLPARLRRLMQ